VLPVRVGSSVARLFILFRHVRWRGLAILVEPFFSTGLLVSEVRVPVASTISHRVPFSHVSMISFSTRIGVDPEGITSSSPHEVDAEDRNADEQSEEDEVVHGHAVTVSSVISVVVAIWI